ncbi:hypothetical protein RCZ01_20770 [Capnocytophaga felis]|uniref:Uncharacterized protein n=1 Tax=Capnocytophaga felis TaxID=2267611 RepID=A0A5M4BC02_9FLAO|nr:hypothetical protein RCZ01_20770 [Capnocytophaga felis]GET48477.1 hypothetical protein RCZ02_13080 [Capnocytophaga felis]
MLFNPKDKIKKHKENESFMLLFISYFISKKNYCPNNPLTLWKLALSPKAP